LINDENINIDIDLSAFLLSDQDINLFNNYIDLYQKIINNNTFNFEILLKNKVTIYDCLKFKYFNENFKNAFQVNISYDEHNNNVLKNNNSFYFLYNINELNMNLYSNLYDVIEELANIKSFFNELYNANEALNPRIDFSLLKYNNFLLL
jgi:hypothetical protein